MQRKLKTKCTTAMKVLEEDIRQTQAKPKLKKGVTKKTRPARRKKAA
jgi:hypothetical protein